MRILYLSHSSGRGEGSVIALFNMALMMQNRGHNVLVIFPDDIGGQEVFKKNGIMCKTILNYCSIYPKSPHIISFFKLFHHIIINLIAVIRISIIAHKFNPDIIHTNVGVMNIGFYISKILHKPHVWHIREMAEFSLGFKPFPATCYKKWLFMRNELNLAITYEVKNFYNLQHNTIVLYDGFVEVEKLPQVDFEKKKYFLYVGAVCEGKGVGDIVDAFVQFCDKNNEYELLFAGRVDNQYLEQLHKYNSRYFDEGKIKILGYRDDVFDLMKKTTALLVASKNEGFGFTTVEAMMNGCLVIGRNSGGTKEQFDSAFHLIGSEVALRCENVKDIEDAMIDVVKNGILFYSEKIFNAQRAVLELYSKKTFENNLVKIYKNIYDEELS